MKVPEFNCELVTKVHPIISIADVWGQRLTSTRFIGVPFMTNSKGVVKGEELICEHALRPKPKRAVKRTWKDVAKEEVAQSKRSKEQSKQV